MAKRCKQFLEKDSTIYICQGPKYDSDIAGTYSKTHSQIRSKLMITKPRTGQ